MNPNSHRGLFFTAAWFNWLAGTPMLFATVPFAGLMGLPLNTAAMLFMQVTAGVVIAFGCAYWMIGRDPVRYRVYIPLGLGLKLYLVALICWYWLSGQIPWLLAALVTGDLVFAILFWRYLRAHPVMPPALNPQ